MLAILLLTVVASLGLGSALKFGLMDAGSPGSGLMPAIGALTMLIALPIVAWQRRAAPAELSSEDEAARPIFILLLLPAVTFALGMIAALFLAALAILVGVDKRPIARSALVSALIVSLASVLFGWLLSVPLPKPIGW